MKKAFLTALATILTLGSAFSQVKTWISTDVGNTYLYEMTDAKGKVTGYTLNRITGVGTDEGKTTIYYHSYSLDTNFKQGLHLTDIMAWTYNGTFHADSKSALSSASMNLEKVTEVKGSGLKLPEEVEVGHVMGDVSVSIPMILDVKQTGMHVAARESLTTPAGTFDCIRIDADLESKALFIKMSGSGQQYYAKGVGLVKSTTYNKKGGVMGGQTLVAINGGEPNGKYYWSWSMFNFGASGNPNVHYTEGAVAPEGMVDMALSVFWAEKNFTAETAVEEGLSCDFKDTDTPTEFYGEGWRTPTKAEWDELIKACTWEYTTMEDVPGYKVTSKNGNSIFIPIPGDGTANYWSTTENPEEKKNVYKAMFNEETYKVVDVPYKGKEFMIRPVCETMVKVGKKK